MISAVILAAGIAIGYLIARIIFGKKFDYLEFEARARAKAIEQEAENILRQAKVDLKSKELEHEKRFSERLNEVEKRNRGVGEV
jgi:ribonuclease Y